MDTTPMQATKAEPLQDELTRTLHELLLRYLDELASSSHGGLWGVQEETLVRRVRDVLLRAGYDPKLPDFVTVHLDGQGTGMERP